MRDPYEILGLDPGAGNAEVKAAYRKLAKQLHPDAQRDSVAHHARFQEVTAAYNQLKDEAGRRRFEAERLAAAAARRQRAFRETAATGNPSPDAQPDDLFSELFEGIRSAGKRVFRARGEDRTYRLAVTFLEAANGATKRVRLAEGKAFDVAIPAGIENGKQIRLKGQGGEGHGGAEAGDALVSLDIEAHPFFERKGHDVHLTLPVTLPEAVLGAKVEVPTVSGPVSLAIPPGSNTGTRLRLKGRGLRNEAASTSGDQYVTLSLALPDEPDSALRDFAASWAEGLRHNPRKSFSGS